MVNQIKLSYILPCYNTASYIRQCIESLYRQGMDENLFEVICVNNATEDNLEEIILDIKEQHRNLRYTKLEKNICAGGAYNEGLRIAEGKFIQFVDSDDYLKDNIQLSLLNTMEEEQLDLLYFNIFSFRGNNITTEENDLRYNGNFKTAIDRCSGNAFIESYVKQKPFSTFPVPAYRKMIRKELLSKNNIEFTPTTIGTDFLHSIELLVVARRVKAITDEVYYFRYNPNGVTKSRLTGTKIVYAINNYSKASIVLEKSTISLSSKSIVDEEIKSLLNSYIIMIGSIPKEEKQKVYVNIQYLTVVKNHVSGFINKFILNYPSLFASISTLFTPNVCSKINRAIRLCR